uniref:Tudor domain-containing protein n=1 Tax=Romanomermis culicivorax TaxID=13658 RepID=A0A915KHW7_ROMCU
MKAFIPQNCLEMFSNGYTATNNIVRPYWKLINNQQSSAPDNSRMTTKGATNFAPAVIRPPAPIDFGSIFSNGGNSNGYFGKSNGNGGEMSFLDGDISKRDEIENESKRRKSEENVFRCETFPAIQNSSVRVGAANVGRPTSSDHSENCKNVVKSGPLFHLSASKKFSQPLLIRKASKSCPKHPNRDISKSAIDLTQQGVAMQSAAAEVKSFNFSRTSLLSTSGYMFLPSKCTSTADACTETVSEFEQKPVLNGIEKPITKEKELIPPPLPLRHYGTCQIVSVETQHEIYIRPTYVKKDLEKFERDLSDVYEKIKIESIGAVTNQSDLYLVENKGEKKIYRVKIVAEFVTPPSKKNSKEQINCRRFFVDFIDYGYKMVVVEDKLKPVLSQYDFVVKTAPFIYRCNFLHNVVISERQKSVATSLLKLLLLVENNEFTYLIVRNNSAETPSVEVPRYPDVTLMKTGFADTISDIFGAFVSNKFLSTDFSKLNMNEKELFENRNFRPFSSNDEDYNQFHFSLDDYKDILEILGWSKIIVEGGKLNSKVEKGDLLVVDRIKKCKILLRRRMIAKDVVDSYKRQNENIDPSNICDDLDVQMAKMNLNL